jgi:hypothetical protein
MMNQSHPSGTCVQIGVADANVTHPHQRMHRLSSYVATTQYNHLSSRLMALKSVPIQIYCRMIGTPGSIAPQTDTVKIRYPSLRSELLVCKHPW